MYVCMYVRMYVCMYVRMYVCSGLMKLHSYIPTDMCCARLLANIISGTNGCAITKTIFHYLVRYGLAGCAHFIFGHY